jgi:hypothetical protein
VSGKGGKTDENHEVIARLVWMGGHYYDADTGPFIPGENIWRALYDAAKKTKRGPRIKEGVFITSDVNPIAYAGPRDPEALWDDENFRHITSAKVGMQRIMRCRPHFRQWRTDAIGYADPEIIDLAEISDIAVTAGRLVGLGDWRPRFGRFTVKVEAI